MEGLHCKNCKNSVEKAINNIEGAAAKVNLKEQTAEVVLENDVADEVLRAAVEISGCPDSQYCIVIARIHIL